MTRFSILDRRLFQLGLGIVVAVILADQASKAVVIQVMQQHPFGLPILPFFSLVAAWNPGVSFSMLRGTGPYLLSGGASLVALALLVWLARTDTLLQAIAIGLIAGGALGNVIDRLVRKEHAVFDFLDFYIPGWDWHWPAFNLADSGISVGVILLLFHGLFHRVDRAKTERS